MALQKKTIIAFLACNLLWLSGCTAWGTNYKVSDKVAFDSINTVLVSPVILESIDEGIQPGLINVDKEARPQLIQLLSSAELFSRVAGLAIEDSFMVTEKDFLGAAKKQGASAVLFVTIKFKSSLNGFKNTGNAWAKARLVNAYTGSEIMSASFNTAMGKSYTIDPFIDKALFDATEGLANAIIKAK